MSIEEDNLLEFLRAHSKEFFTSREISRTVRPRQCVRNGQDDWSKPYLKQMLVKGLVEANDMDHFRIKQTDKDHSQRYLVAPRLAAILKMSGKDFSHSIIIDESSMTYQEYVKELNRGQKKPADGEDDEHPSGNQNKTPPQ